MPHFGFWCSHARSAVALAILSTSFALPAQESRATDPAVADVFDYLNAGQRDDVRSCAPATDQTEAIRKAVRAAAEGHMGRILLPGGCYRTSGTIMLPSNVELAGAAMRATRIMPMGNFPAVAAIGTYRDGLTGVSVQNLSIVCAGMAKSDAMGIALAYVNRGNLKDLYFNGCRHALDLRDQWQTRIDNVTVDGLGVQQNAVGVYMGPPTDPINLAPNNAVILTNSTMQNVAQYGYNLVFFAGSKFANDEAMNGKTGWKLCGEAYRIAAQPCQFGHFVNIIADSTSGPGIEIAQGNNVNAVDNVMFDHVWIGSSSGYGLSLAGLSFSQFDNVHVTSADTGVLLANSRSVKISANVAQYNRRNDGSVAIAISGGGSNTIWATNSQSAHPTGYNGIAERDGTAGNEIWGGLADCTLALTFGGNTREPAYRERSCRYQYDGRQVHVVFGIALVDRGAAKGNAGLTGFPGPIGDNGFGYIGSVSAEAMSALNGSVLVKAIAGRAPAQLLSQGPNGSVDLTERNFTANSRLSGVIDYVRR